MIKNKYISQESNINLMDFLIKNSDYSHSKIKSLFKYQNILVNNNKEKYDYNVKSGDIITITDEIKVKTRLNILFEDEDFLVVNKPIHLITVGLKSEKSLYNMALDYLKQKSKGKRVDLYVLHRIDMETSGIVVFCKNRNLCDLMQDNWNRIVKSRIYTLVVQSGNLKPGDTIKLYLKENDNMMVTVCDKDSGKEAITDYKILNSNKNYTLIEASLKTGRKNQIRVSFAHLGYPIVGDKKYYSDINPIKRLCLVHNKLEFMNPKNKKKYSFSIDIPKEFIKMCK